MLKSDHPKDESEFTGWKLDLMHLVGADPRVTSGQFRMYCRVFRAFRLDWGFAMPGDDLIADECPGTASHHTANDTRKHLKKLGWWDYESGRGLRSTRYYFLNGPSNEILDALLIAKHKRDVERLRARVERPTIGKRRQSKLVSAPSKEASQVGPAPRSSLVPRPPVHPKPSPYGHPPPVQDGTQRDRSLGSDQRCDFCGAPSELRIRIPGSADLWPTCRACVDGVDLQHVEEISRE